MLTIKITWISTVSVDIWLVSIFHEILDVSHFMMCGFKPIMIDFRALFYPNIYIYKRISQRQSLEKTDWFILYLIDRVWYRISWCVQSEKGKPSQVLSPAVDSVRLPEHVFFLVRSPEQGAGSLPQLRPGTLPMLWSSLSRWSCVSIDFMSFVRSWSVLIHNSINT